MYIKVKSENPGFGCTYM